MEQLKNLVFRSLDALVENGYEARARDDDPESVAVDTLDHDAEVEALAEKIAPGDHPSLVPAVTKLVIEWRAIK